MQDPIDLTGPFEGPEQAYHCFLHLIEGGEEFEFEALIAAHPDWETELIAIHDAWQMREGLGRRLGLAESDGESLFRSVYNLPSSDAGPDVPWRSKETSALLQALLRHARRELPIEVEESLGRGGMGEVFAVRDQNLRRGLALKTMRRDVFDDLARTDRPVFEHYLHRFVAEAQVTAQLNHPGIVPVHEVGMDERGRVFFTMARVRGKDLEEHLSAESDDEAWTTTRFIEVLIRVCEAMAYAHARGVVHRDLKPANLMIGHFGEVYVMDWGLALVSPELAQSPSESPVDVPLESTVSTARLDAQESKSGSVLETSPDQRPGTLLYMSPEQALGDSSAVGPRSDVYAIGAILYRVLSGRAPFEREAQGLSPMKQLDLVATKRPAPIARDQAPPELVAICDKAMSQSREDRYDTTVDLARDLRNFLDRRVVGAYETGFGAELKKLIVRNKPTMAAALTAFLFLVAGALGIIDSEVRAASNAEAANEDLKREKAAVEDALRDNRSLLALQHYDSADGELDRGDWRAALASLDEAQFAGYDDLVALNLMRIRANSALAQHARAGVMIQSLKADPELGSRRGSLLLQEVEHNLVDIDGPDYVYTLLDEAFEEGLEGAEQAVALGLRAGTYEAAIDEFRHALELDPAYHFAWGQLQLLLFFSGRYDEAIRASYQFQGTFPSDSDPHIARAYIYAMRGEFDLFEAELLGASEMLDPEIVDQLRGVGRQLSELYSIPPEAWLGAPTQKIGTLMAYATILRRANSKLGNFFQQEEPSHPLIGAATGRIMEAHFKLNKNKWDEAVEIFASSLEVHEDPYVRYLFATSVFAAGVGTDDPLDDVVAAREEWLKVSDLPTMRPGADRAARFWIMHSDEQLFDRDGPERRPLAIENLRWFAKLEDPLDGELAKASTVARLFGEHELEAELLGRWEKFYPEDPVPRMLRVELDLERGDYAAALRGAQALNELDAQRLVDMDLSADDMLQRATKAARTWASSIVDPEATSETR